eukprot:CAMPEP_0197882084 /NCGR_PEP_ID=MMETSP1439-20131203/9353_1 /TAXON_ID=66791 /ORGANISM="Gonyaulax spinifera, Strain CCMP409" /LENGTH=53 /DNA_ID=CAMNT_0043501727 /DNA_START=117 /DNA_END=275 /DNA_ORIENTATION=+
MASTIASPCLAAANPLLTACSANGGSICHEGEDVSAALGLLQMGQRGLRRNAQ